MSRNISPKSFKVLDPEVVIEGGEKFVRVWVRMLVLFNRPTVAWTVLHTVSGVND